MRRILISVLTLTICLLGISPQSQSVEPNKSEFIEWNLGYWWLMFGVSGSHSDIQNYFPWYNYDPENSPYISSQAPLSIRIPKSIILDFSDKDCMNIPIQIRREVPKSVAVDESNILNIEFYPLRLNLSSQTIFSESPIYKLGPNSWNSDSKVVEIQLPACKNLIGASKKSLEGSYINLSFVHKYSRNLNSLNSETSKCMQIISDKCVFTVQSSGSIDLVVNNDRVVLLPELYNSKIKELQDYLDSKPCYPGGIGEQLDANIYCANARDNIQLLNNELPAIKEAAAKFVPISKPTPTPAPALCSREGVTINLASQRYICIDVDGVLNFLPQIEGERLLLIKKEKIKILNKTSELIYLLKSASKKNLSNEIKVTVQDSISEISQYESKYRDSKIIQFDYISADNEVQILEKKVASVMTIIASQKVTISCKKGKLVKKITAVNPKCPTGYKKA